LPAEILIVDPRLSNATPGEDLTFNILASIAQFERQIMLERQREGTAKAKAEGRYKGRKPTARAKADEVRALMQQGVGATEVAKRLGIGRRSVYRVLAP
jgi:DNA invertase Pin-like site-specific DNA recombinase